VLPYPWIMRNLIAIKGQWMYPPAAVSGMVGLIGCGRLDLEHFDVTEFALDDVHGAITDASAHGGPFGLTVLRP
jgi:alcohol dehydrogenase